VRGTAAIALIDAVGIGIGLAIVGVPLVLPISVLVFLGGFIPVIGAFITGLIAVLVALATAEPGAALQNSLIVLAIVVGVQQFESNVLQPVIMRRAVSLHPVVVLSVLTAGAALIGILGAFLAVPIAAVIAAVGNELRLRSEANGQDPPEDPGPDPASPEPPSGEDPTAAMAPQRDIATQEI
jgi:putative heme transporter